jgi:hypothetical protein
MALRKQLNFTGVTEVKTEHGVLTQGSTTVGLNAYIKVEEVKASKSDAIAVVSMTDGDKRLVMTTQFAASFDAGAKNTIAQAYDALKQMPLFVGAEDC